MAAAARSQRAVSKGTAGRDTGIALPYEAPDDPEIGVFTGRDSLEECVAVVTDYLRARNMLPEITVLRF